MSSDNPYAPPAEAVPAAYRPPKLDAADHKKVEAIVKDAGQFWLAIILCMLCCGIGAPLIVLVWYLIRLLQWNKFAKKYPELTIPNAPPGSLPARFQSSKWKLIVGIGFGCAFFALLFAWVAFDMFFIFR